MNQSIVITDPTGISYARLASLKGCVKLEAAGMKMSRGVNVTAIVRRELGLKPRTPHQEVMNAIQQRMDTIIAQRRLEASSEV